MLSPRQTSRSDRGASMVLALGIIVVVLGFGAVVIDLATAEVRTGHRMLQRDQSQVVAELAASEAIGHIVDGETEAFTGEGAASIVDYGYEAEPDGTTTWRIVAWAGSEPDIATVNVSLTRGVDSGGPATPAAPLYALWAEKIEVHHSNATISAPVGVSEELKLEGESLGTEQHLLPGAECNGCANPILVSSHTSIDVPDITSPLACPTTKKDEIKNTTIAAGVYLCSGKKVKFGGSVQFTGPVVFVIGDDTKLEFKNAEINTSSHQPLLFVQVGSDSSEVKIENSSFVADIVMPNAEVKIKKSVSWVGSIEAEKIKLDKATVTVSATISSNIPAVVDGSSDRYAIWTEDLLDFGWVRSGTVAGPIGSRTKIKFWYSHSVGASHNVVTGGTCINCSNRQWIDGYELTVLPDNTASQACPTDGGYRIRNRELGGSYLCDRSGSTLRIRGEITIAQPTVLHIGANTRLDIRDAEINLEGSSADFRIVRETTTSWADEATIDDVTMRGQILTPTTWWWVGDITWRGTFEVGTFWLYDWANIDGAWDGVAPPTPGSGAWEIAQWETS